MKVSEIKVIELCSCRLQYNWIDQMCDHNQDSIEICSAQQVRADKELLYTKTDFLRHTHWQTLTDFCFHASSHVDNVTSLIMLLCWLAENFISDLNFKSNLELSVKCFVTEIEFS